MKLTENKKRIIGWIAVSISAIFANLWAYWGINENFHEGWYNINHWDNVLMMFGQYLIVPFAFIILGFVSVRWNKVGAILHVAIAFYMYFHFGQMIAGLLFITIPILSISFLYWFGSIQNKTIAYSIIIVLPLILIISIGSVHLFKVSNRFNDNNFEARNIKGNGVELIWAPAGPGWPDNGTSWEEAKQICSQLSEEGNTISKDELNIWRLPTVEEAVASQVYHGANAGGVWNHQTKKVTYNHQPDKESPIWNVNVKTIYWWTSTSLNDKQAYIIVYNGSVYLRNKKIKMGYLNFRAVKDINK